ncbi:MAG: cation:proton antiporter [Sedimentisphaerales bacterium]|nr:cation:proton antiporter [Sedimentisphaerales bacterium]
MTDSPLNIIAEISRHINPILFFGIIILGGTFASRLFQRLHIPQVVGCIVMGVLLGQVLNVITAEYIEKLHPFTMFALGIIGFMIGSELRGDVFKKYGKQFFIILFAQGIGAFILVCIGTAALTWLIFKDLRLAFALGLVLGAIASATAPAATVNVLWEFKTRGPLTAAILAIVALDDALALVLYRAAATGAKALMGTGQTSVLAATGLLFGEIIAAILLGFFAGLMLYFLLKFVRADDKILGFSISSLLIVVGITIIPKIDPILPAMTFGITIANLSPRQSKNTFSLVEKFSPPMYTAFFVLAGAHMQFNKLDHRIISLILIYVICRAAGKIFGSAFGAYLSKASANVRKYLGICLLPQAGVAIGLAILASQQFSEGTGQTIILVVMTGTFLMEIFGPMLVKAGVKKAGEAGLNVTEEDLIKQYNVSDVMDTEPVTITQDTPLHEILGIFSRTDMTYYPVIDSENKIIGVVTINGIREMFMYQDVAGWLLACDVAVPVKDRATPLKPLEEVIEHMNLYDIEGLPVVDSESNNKLVGLLDRRKTMRKISTEVLNRRQKADGFQLAF